MFSAALKSATDGDTELELDFTGDVKSLLEVLKEKYGESFEKRLFENGSLRRFINVYLDGKDIRFLQGLDTSIPNGSEVLFLPAVSGG